MAATSPQRPGTPARPLARRLSSRQSLAALLDAPELAQLDAITPSFDPLEVLAWTHSERPHTRFLAWLLDPAPHRPGGGHGLGTAVLRGLVARAIRSIDALPGVEPAAIPRHPAPIDPAGVSVLREAPFGDGVRVSARAPDIRCVWRDPDGTPWVVVIENKIDAGEGDGQIRDYLAWAAREHPGARRLLLYVTPDGRDPDSPAQGELVVPLTWSDVADAALDAIGRVPPPADAAARAFATSVLDALRMRFGGRADVRSLVEALHDAHPRAAALAASPATEPSLLEALTQRFPSAAWHLRTLRPRARRWTRAWADAVTAAFRDLAPDAPALVACAPHVDRPDMASWSIDGVTESLSLHLFCASGLPFGAPRPRAWVALRAPNLHPRDLFEHRDQLAAVDALPEATRAWLLGAAPVFETPGAWRWLCAGSPITLPRGFSLDDDARRTARCLHDLIGPHLAALAGFARDPEQRLYSCDLDPDHVIPGDGRDRESLAREARVDALHVTLTTRQPTRHPHELRRERDLALTLGASFGGTSSLTYDYAPAASLGLVRRSDVVVAGVGLFRAPDDSTLREAAETIHEAVDTGAWLLLCGDRGDLSLARRHLGALVAPITGVAGVEEFAPGEAELVADDAGFDALCERDARRLGGALCVTLLEGVRVALHLRDRRGVLHPLVAGWRAGERRVVWWGGGALGPWGRGLREHPDTFARWWNAIVAFARTL
jgi:hypothetical protein